MDKQNEELKEQNQPLVDSSDEVQQSAELPENKEPKESNESIDAEQTTVSQKVDETEKVVAASEQEEQEEEQEDETPDFEHFDKQQLVDTIVSLKNEEDIRKVDRMIRPMKARFDELFNEERQLALDKFLQNEGVTEEDFVFKGEKLDERFNDYYGLLRDKRNAYFKNLEQEKEKNLLRKQEILDRIRDLVDGEETNISIKALRSLQDEWKSVGPIPTNQNRTLWANYHALLDRFYDARSIYFELKELDRKKNYDQKIELCEKAEILANQENVKEAVVQLNELHEEYKHIGPVPAEVQEELWQRFKAASDAVYAQRKEYVEELKKELHENFEKKSLLAEKVKAFKTFDSDKITEWNEKTRELLDIQKQWDAIGGLPKDKAKAINKAFWSTFKQFFNAKNQFFKQLESKKEENLVRKRELLEQAEKMKVSTEWEKTARGFKQLQEDWRNVGPVPEKDKNELYKHFKSACDHFFNQRRDQSKKAEEQFEINYQEKLKLCDQVIALSKGKTIDLDEVLDLIDKYMEIGFVPRKVVKKMHARFDEAVSSVKSSAALSAEDKVEFDMQVQLNKLKGSPHGNRKINRKEQAIRRKIQTIENDINTYKTNIEFFASSKTADKLKLEMNQNIEKAEDEIDQLKKQLQILKEA